MKGLKFDAWAHHPYPDRRRTCRRLQKVRYPNVTLSTLPKFEKDLKTWFHRTVPIWITEYGHETKPGEPNGVTTATQAAYAKQALDDREERPERADVHLVHLPRQRPATRGRAACSSRRGAAKPSYSAFGSVARQTDGLQMNVRAGRAPTVTLYFPVLAYYNSVGTTCGMTYKVTDGSRTVVVAQPAVPLRANQSLVFPATFTPVKKHTYTITVTANDPNGHSETRVATLKAI